MNEEQKQFNIEDSGNVEPVSVDTDVDVEIKNSSVSEEVGIDSNTSTISPTVNDFVYAEPSTFSGAEIPTEPSVNAFSYVETPSSINVEIPTGENNSTLNGYGYTTLEPTASVAEMPMPNNTVSTSNTFLYTEPNTVAEESVVVPSHESVNISTPATPVESSYSQMNFSQDHSVSSKNEIKNNIIFMVIFGLVMIAIIFALPYIAGYK